MTISPYTALGSATKQANRCPQSLLSTWKIIQLPGFSNGGMMFCMPAWTLDHAARFAVLHLIPYYPYHQPTYYIFCKCSTIRRAYKEQRFCSNMCNIFLVPQIAIVYRLVRARTGGG